MARTSFFSFSYEDVKNFRVNVVRNSWLLNKENIFKYGSIWEKEKNKSVSVIKPLIDNGLKGTSVTAVLIGSDTANRRWINYEIIKSFEKGNGILAIHINRIKDKTQKITSKGLNPFDRLAIEISKDCKKISFMN
jgi:hypothetical protein